MYVYHGTMFFVSQSLYEFFVSQSLYEFTYVNHCTGLYMSIIVRVFCVSINHDTAVYLSSLSFSWSNLKSIMCLCVCVIVPSILGVHIIPRLFSVECSAELRRQPGSQ